MTISKLTKIYKQKVYNKVGNAYTIESSYINSKTTIKIKHNECGTVFYMKPNSFLRNPHCNFCRKRIRRQKEAIYFKKKVYKLTSGTYSVVGKYFGYGMPIKMRHNKCGTIFSVSPKYFLLGNRCPKCNGTLRNNLYKNTILFKKRVFKLVGNEYTVLGKYTGCSHKIKIRHNTCGYVFFMTPSHFLSGERCPKCADKIRRKHETYTTKQIIKLIHNKYGNEYTALSKYNGIFNRMKFRHNKCGHIIYISPHNLLEGFGCQYRGKQKVNLNQFQETRKRFYKITGNRFKIMSPYNGEDYYIWLQCLKCGYIYKTEPIVILKGGMCPRCQHRKVCLLLIHCGYENFKKFIYTEKKNHYRICSKFYGVRRVIILQHTLCHKTFVTTPAHFENSVIGCPYCYGYHYHGEIAIKRWLQYHHIFFIHSYKLTNSSPYPRYQLHLDFYLPKYHIAIEFDGYEHFHYVDYDGTVNRAKKTRNKLKIKQAKKWAHQDFRNEKYRDKNTDYYSKQARIHLLRVEELVKSISDKKLIRHVNKDLNKYLIPLLKSKSVSADVQKVIL